MQQLHFGGATGTALDLRSTGRGFKSYSGRKLRNNLGQVVHTYVPVTKQYKLVLANGRRCSAAGKVTAGLAESNGSLPPGGWLIVTCGLTACTLGSAPDPTLSNEYGKPLPLNLHFYKENKQLSDKQFLVSCRCLTGLLFHTYSTCRLSTKNLFWNR